MGVRDELANRLRRVGGAINAYAAVPAPIARVPVENVPMYGFLEGEEIRNTGTVSTLGDNQILAASQNFDIEVLEVTLQPAGAVTVQLKEASTPMSGAWSLVPLQFASLAGKIIDRSNTLFLNLSAAVSVAFEIRWRPAYRRPLGDEGEGPAEE